MDKLIDRLREREKEREIERSVFYFMGSTLFSLSVILFKLRFCGLICKISSTYLQ